MGGGARRSTMSPADNLRALREKHEKVMACISRPSTDGLWSSRSGHRVYEENNRDVAVCIHAVKICAVDKKEGSPGGLHFVREIL